MSLLWATGAVLNGRLIRLFRRHGVGLFRGKDFHDGKGDFKGWSSPKQLGFIQGWFDIAQEHVLAGVTLSMVRGAYEGFKKQSGKLQNRSAYGHCFDELLNSLLSDDVVGPQILDDGLSLFVESGANGNDGVLSIFNKRKANDGAPFLEQLSFIDKRACRAIQLADFLAFYSRRHGAAHLKGQRMSPFLELAKDKVRIIAQLGEHFRDVPLKVSS